MSSGIYKITSVSHPDRIYIGSAMRQHKRKQEHLQRLKNGIHPNYRLFAHVKKYGIDDLQFAIIEKCSIKMLIEREQFYIDLLRPSFNICKVAANTTGRPQSEETRLKRSISLKGRIISDETKHRMRLARKTCKSKWASKLSRLNKLISGIPN